VPCPATAAGAEEPETPACQQSERHAPGGRRCPTCSAKRRCCAPICGKEWGDGLAGDIRRLLWVATQVRERFSLDNWHAINRCSINCSATAKLGQRTRQPELSEALAFLDQVLLTSSSLAGFAMDNMTRDDGWRFLIIGRRIERLIFLANAVAGFLRLETTRAPAASSGCWN
jgi:uncharacterized alpha-E superfamily protein